MWVVLLCPLMPMSKLFFCGMMFCILEDYLQSKFLIFYFIFILFFLFFYFFYFFPINFKRFSNVSITNIVAMNITTLEFSPSINRRFSDFFQSPDEIVNKIEYSSYKSTIFILADSIEFKTKSIYYQQLNSTFDKIGKYTQAICVIHYNSLSLFVVVSSAVGGTVFIFSVFLAFFCVFNHTRKRRNNYIKLPDYHENSIQNNFDSILSDKSVPKINPKKLVLGKQKK